MDFSLNDDQRSIQALIKRLLADIVTDESLKALEKGERWFHQRAWSQLAASEMLGLAIPEAHGGAGMGLTELCLLLEQVGRAVAPVPAVPTLVSVALPLAEFGSDAQKDRWLPRIAAGEAVLTAALVDTGSRDARRPSASATREGSGYRVSGRFTNVPYAWESERVLVPALGEEGSPVLVLVDPSVRGVRLGHQRGTNGEPLALVDLQRVRVDEADILAGPARGESALRFVVERTQLGFCAVELGIAEQSLVMTAKYAAERKQFGTPIGAFQGVTQRVGDAYIDVQAMKTSTWQACWRLDQGLDAARELSVARFWASEGGARVVAAAQHVHGGMGFDRDYPLYRYFLTSKHLEFTLGGPMESLTALGHLITS